MRLDRSLSLTAPSPAHWPFILASLRRCLESDRASNVQEACQSMEFSLRANTGRFIIASPVTDNTIYLGWSAVDERGDLVYCYVVRALRRLGIGAHLVTSLTDAVPVRLVHWSRFATAIQDHGWPLIEAHRHNQRSAA